MVGKITEESDVRIPRQLIKNYKIHITMCLLKVWHDLSF